jgi:ribonucleoside-diphosphate reductase alpha chain
VPIASLVNKFTHQRFEPAGMTTNPDIPFAKSLVDYIFRWMGMEFIEGYRDANAPQRAGSGRDNRDSRIDLTDSGEFPAIRGAGAGTQARHAAPAAPSREEPRPSAKRGAPAPASKPSRRDGVAQATIEVTSINIAAAALSVAMTDCQGDAPACDNCGTITVRSGTCYKCLNCGHSMGCS